MPAAGKVQLVMSSTRSEAKRSEEAGNSGWLWEKGK